MKATRLTAVLVAIFCSQVALGQYTSSYHEDQLIYGPKLEAGNRYYKPKGGENKKLTFVLPNFSTTMISPQLTYGDLYVAETKTLDLTIGTDSQKDFDLQLNARLSYGGLSYKHERFRFSFFHELSADARMYVPHHLFKLATEGNSQLGNSDVEINPRAMFQSTHKWAIGADYQLDNLLVGVQANVYTGNAYLNTHSSTMKIEFQENFFQFGFDKNINVESSGAINYSKIDSVDFMLGDNALTPTGSFSNLGFGISAQFSYEFSESLKFFGRLEDLGFIKWTNDTQILNEQSYEEFGGFDIRESYVNGETYSVQDTFYSKLEIDANNNHFSSALLNSFFVGANYAYNEYFSGGLILRTKNNGFEQVFFAEPFLTFSPLHNTYLTIANVFQTHALLNPKVAFRTEISNTFGLNLSLINPWQVGQYYDSNMIHASLGIYLKFIKED